MRKYLVYKYGIVFLALIFVLFFASIHVYADNVLVPSWVKSIAKMWSKNQIDDTGFVQIMQYLIEQNIVKIPTTKTASTQDHIPGWVKNNAGWWADGTIADSDFVKTVQYLVSVNIIQMPTLSSLSITSTAFTNNGIIPRGYTCDGEGQSPPLSIENVPKLTQSLVLIMDDPDAKPNTFVHWVVWNISPATTLLPKGEQAVSPQQMGKSGLGKPGYVGPCPPSGTHRYYFKLYALDEMLSFDHIPDKYEVENVIRGHIISNSTLIGLYSRG